MSARLPLRFVLRPCAAALALAVLAAGSTAEAQFRYWMTTGTGLWSDTVNWSSNATSGGAGASLPVANSGTAFFNQSTANGNTVVELSSAAVANYVMFRNTGSTLFRASASGTQSLTIGNANEGIMMEAGAGPVTFGDATNAVPVTWNTQGYFRLYQNSDSLVRFRSGLTFGSGNFFYIDGTSTGGVWIDGLSWGNKTFTKFDPGTLTLDGTNRGTSAINLNSGTLSLPHSGIVSSAGFYATAATAYWAGGLANNAAVVFSGSAGSADQALAGVVSGSGPLRWARPGTLTLLGGNTQTGTTTIASGTLVVGYLQGVSEGTLGAGDYVNNGARSSSTTRARCRSPAASPARAS